MSLLKIILGERAGNFFHVKFGPRPLIGAGNSGQYAYESLALAPFTPIGPASDAYDNFETMQPPQVMNAQTVIINGMPEQAGQIAAPSLYVPKE